MSSSAWWAGLMVAGAALAIVGVLAPGPARSERDRPPKCASDELFVKFRPGADPAAVSARHGATITAEIAFIGVHVVSIPPGTGAEKVAEFQAAPEVEYAEPVGVATIPESPPSCP